MSDGEPVEGDEQPKEEKPKDIKAPPKPNISSINAALDDLSFSLGMAFPGFGSNISRSQYSSNSNSMGQNSKTYQSKYNPSYGATKGGPGVLGPRDLMSRNERPEVVQNELLMDKRTRPNTVQPNPSSGMNLAISQPPEMRDFGIQTSDSLRIMNGGGYPMNTLPTGGSSQTSPALQNSRGYQPSYPPGQSQGGTDSRRKVDFSDRPPGFKDKAGSNTPYDINASNMKQFTKNVQDLYKRKPKAGNHPSD